MDPLDQPQNPTPTPDSPQPPAPEVPAPMNSEAVPASQYSPSEVPQLPDQATASTSSVEPSLPVESPIVMGQTPPSFVPEAPILPVAPTKKSNKGLILGLVGGFVLLVVIALVSLVIQASNVMHSATERAVNKSATTSTKPNSAEVASSAIDFEAVCGGGSISNAAAFNGRSTAIITTFSQSPRVEGSWSYESVGYGKPYYAASKDFATINVVACLSENKDLRAVGQTCDYKDQGKTVSVKYYSSQYKLTYYEAKTGKKIAEGGPINAPANKCPSFIAYNPETLSAFATPDVDALDAAYTTFMTN